MGHSIILGVDVGQMKDYTAILAVDRNEKDDSYEVRTIERPRLRTKYPKIIARVKEIRDYIKEQTGKMPVIMLDVTGVGRGLFDEFTRCGVITTAVTIVAGEDFSIVPDSFEHEIHVGKKALIGRLNVLLEGKRIGYDKGSKMGKKLKDELHRFLIRVNKNATAIFEAQSGFHDDLVIALALAVWRGKEKPHARVLWKGGENDFDPSGFRNAVRSGTAQWGNSSPILGK